MVCEQFEEGCCVYNPMKNAAQATNAIIICLMRLSNHLKIQSEEQLFHINMLRFNFLDTI